MLTTASRLLQAGGGVSLPAIAAFNVITLEYAEGIVRAAEAANTPVLLSISHNAVRFHGALTPLGRGCLALAESAAVPVGLHLDHCEDPALIDEAAGLGFGSAMFDASTLPYAQNVAATAAVASRGHELGIWIEAELGEIGGKDGAHAPGVRTDPDDAAAFVAATDVNGLAVAVGTSHAMTERTAYPDTELIARIAAVVPVPLVLHGSSGVSDDGLRAAVAAGIRKVNVGTQLSTAYTRALSAGLGPGPDPRKALSAARDAIAADVERLLGIICATPARTPEVRRSMSATVSGPSSHAGEPTAAALLEAGDIVGLMRACHDRRLEREGIPMVLGFVDERGPIPESADTAQRAEGEEYARIFDEYTAALVPFARDDDEGAVIAAMQVLAYTHFAPGATPISDAAAAGSATDEGA